MKLGYKHYISGEEDLRGVAAALRYKGCSWGKVKQGVITTSLGEEEEENILDIVYMTLFVA